jgi:methionyl-tRNA formyltransferase
LPDGRGWSPHVWQIINGANLITLTLLEAEDIVDTGDIWKKSVITISKDLLWHEINNIIFSNELLLMDFAINNFDTIIPLKQEPTSKRIKYLRRSPLDSQIDINKSISSQFDLIRVCEPDRYPAFFKIHGKKYKIILEKYKDEQ